MAYVYLSDLGQTTNRIQADNAYSRGRSAANSGDARTARLALAELQFTYNNARNAGASDEAEAIWRLYSMLKSAVEPGSAPAPAPSGPVTVDIAATKTSGGPSSGTSGAPGGDSGAPNYLLWGGIALGTILLVGVGVSLARSA